MQSVRGSRSVAGVLERCRSHPQESSRWPSRGAGLPYYNPHSIRKTLVQLGEQLCSTPEEFKAWSQNLGHEQVMTTFRSYGSVSQGRQAELIRKLAQPKVSEYRATQQTSGPACCECLKMHRQGVAIGVYELGPPNKAGLRNVFLVRPRTDIPAPKLPRYVQTRKLAGRANRLLLVPPWWARGEDCPLCNEALGTHLDTMKERAGVLNAQLDAWRIARKYRCGDVWTK